MRLRGRLTRGAAWLVWSVAGFFLLWLFGNAAIKKIYADYLVLTPHSAFQQGHLWELVTASLIYPGNIVSLLIDGLMLFLFVPVLERWWGTRRFMTFAIATSVVGNLAAAMLGWVIAPDLPIFGLGPFIYSSIIAFGVLFADHPVSLFGVVPIKGRSLAIGAAALMALMVLLDRKWVMGAGAFAAMGLAYVMTTGTFTPNLWWLKLRKWRLRKKFGVIEGGKKADKQKWVN